MKIAHLLSQYLLQNKKMQLQGLGEFTMENFYDNPFEQEKGKIKIPGNTIRFTPDKKCKEDLGLIEFISKNTGKIKPLAFSDLEDFLNIGKQLLNVSKQFYIEGLGTLVLDAHNNLSFSQGDELVPAALAEDFNAKKIKEVKEDSSGISFTDDYAPRASGNNARKILVTIVILLGLAIIGWVAYYFYNQWQESKSASSVPQDIQPVLTPTGTQTSDSAVNKPAVDSMNAATVVPNADSAAASYSVIIETSGKNRALKRHQDLLDMGYKVKLATSDSITFQIYTSINGPLSDTTRVRDSIARFFGRRVIIDRALK